MVSARPGTRRSQTASVASGGDIAGGEAGAAGGDDKIGCCGEGSERGRDLGLLVGDYVELDARDVCLQQQLDDGWAGEIDLLAGRAAVADGEDSGASSGERGGAHSGRGYWAVRLWSSVIFPARAGRPKRTAETSAVESRSLP